MYKIVAVDLDETLLNHHKKVCKRNVDAIRKAREMGVKVVLASGRTPGILGTTMEELHLQHKNEYCILANGAIIVDNEKNDVIYAEQLPIDMVETLFEYGKRQEGLGIQIFTPEKIYFYFTDDEEWNYTCTLGSNIERRDYDDISDLKDKIILKMVFNKRDMNYLHKLAASMEDMCKDKISISFSSNRYLELNKLGTNKGCGLHHLAQYLHVDIKDTIAIGDSFNDLEIIQEAGLGCAMANAIPQAKEIADYICESDHNEGGVGEVIEKFILQKEV